MTKSTTEEYLNGKQDPYTQVILRMTNIMAGVNSLTQVVNAIQVNFLETKNNDSGSLSGMKVKNT